eukprot:4587129-Lingulodinium_polyedra.AAC.1
MRSNRQSAAATARELHASHHAMRTPVVGVRVARATRAICEPLQQRNAAQRVSRFTHSTRQPPCGGRRMECAHRE